MAKETGSIQARREPWIKTYLRTNGGILIALAVLLLVMTVTRGSIFWTTLNMKSLLMTVTTTSLLGLGMTVLLISGYIDLSPGSTYCLCAVWICKMITDWGCNFYVALIGTLILGALTGVLTGTVITKTGMPAFIVTLAMDGVKRGIAYLISGDKLKIYCTDPTFKSFGMGYFLGLPISLFIIAGACIIVAIILNRTVTGRHLYATGGNQQAAVNAGVNVKKMCIISYVIMGVLGAIAGIISAAKTTTGNPTIGTDVMSDAVASAVLGGTAFSGGKGTVMGTVTGVILIGVVLNGMNLLQINYYWQMLFKGLLILFAVYIDTVKSRNSGKLRLRKAAG